MGWVGDMQYFFTLMDQPGWPTASFGWDLEGDDFEFQDVTLSFLPYTNPQIANFTSIGHSEADAVRWHNGAVDDSTTASSRTGASALTSRTSTPVMPMSSSSSVSSKSTTTASGNVGDSLALDTMILYEGPVWNGNMQIQDHFVANNNVGSDLGLDDTFSALAGFVTSGVDPFPTVTDSVLRHSSARGHLLRSGQLRRRF